MHSVVRLPDCVLDARSWLIATPYRVSFRHADVISICTSRFAGISLTALDYACLLPLDRQRKPHAVERHSLSQRCNLFYRRKSRRVWCVPTIDCNRSPVIDASGDRKRTRISTCHYEFPVKMLSVCMSWKRADERPWTWHPGTRAAYRSRGRIPFGRLPGREREMAEEPCNGVRRRCRHPAGPT